MSMPAPRSAIVNGKSLLPAGVTRVEGNFARGDCVLIRNARGGEIGRGLVAYDASEAVLIAGRNSQDIDASARRAGPRGDHPSRRYGAWRATTYCRMGAGDPMRTILRN